MSERIKKWLLWFSVILIIISLIAIFYSGSTSNKNEISRNIGNFSIPIFVLSALNFAVIISLKYLERKWLRKFAGYSVYILIITVVINALLYDYINSKDTFLAMFTGLSFVIILFFSTLLTLINFFVIKEQDEIRSVLVLLLLVLISGILFETHFISRVFDDFYVTVFVIFTILTGCGMYIYGIRCLFQINKNRYLKFITFFSGTFIAYGSIIFSGKMLNSNVDILELIYFIPALIITLIILLTLPLSGYINWDSLHKKVMRKVMITWVFFLFVFSLSFVFPEKFKKIVFTPTIQSQEFEIMIDYKIENKNGLEIE